MKFISKMLLLVLLIVTAASAQSVEITIKDKTKKVKTVKKSKVTYLSLNDLSSKFNLKLTKSSENTKFDLAASSKSSIKFTAKNPNAVVTKDKKSKTYKMSKSAIKDGSDLLIPVAASQEAFSSAFEDKYNYKIPKDGSIADKKDTTKQDDKPVTKKDDDEDDKDVKTNKKTVIGKASYEVKSNGTLARFFYTGEANGIKHTLIQEGKRYISITIEKSDITLKNVEKTFKSGPVKEVKGRVRKGTGELMIYISDSYSSYEVKRIKSKKEIQVLVYSKSESGEAPVKKKMTGNLM
ncbi:hypothetical protein MASR1M107_04230 [Ignavibacteriales bacterium]